MAVPTQLTTAGRITQCRWCAKPLTKDQIRRSGTFCSRRHARQAQMSIPLAVRRAWIDKATEKRREHDRKRIIDAIIADFKPIIGPDGEVKLSDAVRVVVKHRRLGYQRGWTAYYARDQRRRGTCGTDAR